MLVTESGLKLRFSDAEFYSVPTLPTSSTPVALTQGTEGYANVFYKAMAGTLIG